jgi:hypothetical protein
MVDAHAQKKKVPSCRRGAFRLMSARVGFWIAGLIWGVALAAVLPEDLFPAARPVVAGTTFLAIGLLGEIMQARRARAAYEVVCRAFDTRASDGRVDLARMDGVRGEANPVDPRFKRFREFETEIADPIERARSVALDGRRSPPLLGRVAIVSLFLGRDRRAWSDVEIAEAHCALERIGVWVEREAARWGAAVNIEIADTFFVFDDEPAGVIEPVDVFSALLVTTRAAAKLGLTDVIGMFRQVRARLVADEVVWLVHPRRAGWSFAVPREFSDWDGVCLSVCYPRWAMASEPLGRREARIEPDTVVHEILHLFGASDKYERPLRAFAPRMVTRRDVMRLSERRLARLQVDPRTALEIGWAKPGQPFPPEKTPAGASPKSSRRPVDIDDGGQGPGT